MAQTDQTRRVVRECVAALQRGDIDALWAIFSPDATWSLRGGLPVSGTWTGPDQILDVCLALPGLALPGRARLRRSVVERSGRVRGHPGRSRTSCSPASAAGCRTRGSGPPGLTRGTGERAGRATAPGTSCARPPARGRRGRTPSTPSPCPRRGRARGSRPGRRPSSPRRAAVDQVRDEPVVIGFAGAGHDERPRLRVSGRRRPARGLDQRVQLCVADRGGP